MRTHKQIIEHAGGHSKVAELLGEKPGTVKQWKRNDSIPGVYWDGLAKLGLASLEELASDAAKRRRSSADAAELSA